MTSKGKQAKTYQTPYGSIAVKRHVYQGSIGGTTYCPLEVDAMIIITSTPRSAKQISHKYAEMSSVRQVEDLRENHGRDVHRSFVQTLVDAVGSIALSKEEDWTYRTPKLDIAIPTVSIGLDGTCMLLCDEGYRQAMVGTISLYNQKGERQHTTYIAAAPEYGRETFLGRLQLEVETVKQLSQCPLSMVCQWRTRKLGFSEYCNQHPNIGLLPCHPLLRQRSQGDLSTR